MMLQAVSEIQQVSHREKSEYIHILPGSDFRKRVEKFAKDKKESMNVHTRHHIHLVLHISYCRASMQNAQGSKYQIIQHNKGALINYERVGF